MIASLDVLGKHICVSSSSNKDLVGITGTVFEETNNTLRVRTDRGDKALLKAAITIQVDDLEIDGKLLVGRPDKRNKRTKKWQRKKP